MKRIYILGLIAVLFYCLACQDNNLPGKGYILSGSIKNAKSKKVFLEEITATEFVIIDTTTLTDNGSFIMSGHISEPGFYRLRTGKKNKGIIFVLDNTPTVIHADYKNLQQYTIKGSKDNKILKSLFSSANNTFKKFQALEDTLKKATSTEEYNDIKKSIQKDFQKLIAEQNNYIKTFIDTSSSIVAIFATNFLNPNGNIHYLQGLIEKFEKEFPNSKYTKRFAERIQSFNTITIGNLAPDIKLLNPDGDSLSLSSLKGKVVLLDFWASWCRPCRIENPNIVRLYNKYKDKGFEIFSASLDQNKQSWRTAIEQDKLIWKHHVSDLKGWQSVVTKLYKIKSIPCTFLIDRQGILIAKNLRGKALALKIDELLNNMD